VDVEDRVRKLGICHTVNSINSKLGSGVTFFPIPYFSVLVDKIKKCTGSVCRNPTRTTKGATLPSDPVEGPSVPSTSILANCFAIRSKVSQGFVRLQLFNTATVNVMYDIDILSGSIRTVVEE
jgi:hypothetical protein